MDVLTRPDRKAFRVGPVALPVPLFFRSQVVNPTAAELFYLPSLRKCEILHRKLLSLPRPNIDLRNGRKKRQGQTLRDLGTLLEIRQNIELRGKKLINLQLKLNHLHRFSSY